MNRLNGRSIAFAYHSGKMENENVTYNDTREIFEHDSVTSYTGDLRTLFEIFAGTDSKDLGEADTMRRAQKVRLRIAHFD